MDRAMEMGEEEAGRRIYRRMMSTGVFSVLKLLATSAGDVKRLRRPQALETRYVRPPCRYEIPALQEGMTILRSRERYLRPTRLCNSRAPEVVALAHSLGAFQLPDAEYVQAAFEFAKEKMVLEIGPISSVEEILRRGTGSCFELITVFIALCRAAGIRARYKLFATNMIDAWREGMIDIDPLLKKWYDTLGYFLIEGEGEAYVDGRWQVAHVGPTAERQAAAGIPITRFGEDAIGTWFEARPGTIMLLESLPWGLAGGSRLLHRIAPASMERVNVSVLKQIKAGREILAAAGGPQAYDQASRRRAQEPSLENSAPVAQVK